jgi:hypothetical protein
MKPSATSVWGLKLLFSVGGRGGYDDRPIGKGAAAGGGARGGGGSVYEERREETGSRGGGAGRGGQPGIV